MARWDLAGADPRVIATEIFETVGKAGLVSGDKAWAEVLEVGATAPLRTLEIPRAELFDEQPTMASALEGADGMPAMLGVVVGAIVQTNAQLSSQLVAALAREHDTMMAHVNSTARATASETLLSWIEEHGMPGDDGDGFAKAVEILGPSLAPAIASLAAGMSGHFRAKRTGAPAVETDGERADRLLAEMATIPADTWMQDGRRQRVEVGLAMLSDGMERWRRENAAGVA